MGLAVDHLKCNYLTDPLGVDDAAPRLCWMLHSDERNRVQKAYRVLAANRLEFLDEGVSDFWDSGRVESDQSVHIKYEGKRLESRQGCYWKVRVWDNSGAVSGWSRPAYFEMGILHESDWRARWIGSPSGGCDISNDVPAPLFRKSFSLDKKVVRARVYVCGLGYHDLYINGGKIGEDALAPAFTRYDRTLLYNTYDVTEALRQGENVVGVTLGNGWYNCFTSEVWDFRQAPWRHHPKLLLQMHVELEGNENLVIASDGSWKVSTGPILFDALRNGEFYDARCEKPGWNEPGCDCDGWMTAKICRSPGGVLHSFQMTPIKVTDIIKPIGLKEAQPGVWVYDIGKNISGWARIRVSGHAGTQVVLKYAEKVDPESGCIDQSNINWFIKSGEPQTDKYTLKGEGLEEWEPRFTYHGFQYVQVTGFPGTPALDDLCAKVVHTAFDTTGEFECSDKLLNDIQQCARRSTLTNYHGIPTDCPHREKNGWTGDAALSAEQCLMNFDPMSAYAKWMKDFKDVQRYSGQLPGIVPTGGWGYNWGSGPAWDSAMVLIPWYIYLYCGDMSVLEDVYDNIKSYVEFMVSMADGYIVDFGLGDWCPPIGEFGDYKCPAAVTDTAYFYVDALILSKAAVLLNRGKDAEKYAGLAGNIRRAFREKFIDMRTGIVEGDCQTSTACALYQGMVNDDEKQKVLDILAEQIYMQDSHIDCGILGTKYVMHSLTDLGRADLAYTIATQTAFPGWGHWIAQGATTLWETWKGQCSRNHHMFSDISAWFYKGLAGINPDPDRPGFKHIVFRPNPVKGLDWVRSYHISMYGRIDCNWKAGSGTFEIQVAVPVNCYATLYLPVRYSGNVFENGKPVSSGNESVDIRRDGGGAVILKLGSGVYNFRAEAGNNFNSI